MSTYLILTCNGYTVEATASTLDAAISECNARELATMDGYCRVVSLNGTLVADAEGEWDRRSMDAADPFDVACERRFD